MPEKKKKLKSYSDDKCRGTLYDPEIHVVYGKSGDYFGELTAKAKRLEKLLCK